MAVRLRGKVALVTGVAGPRGIGFASARRLAEEGASIAAADVSDEVYARAKDLDSSASKVIPLRVDLTQSKAVIEMTSIVLREFERIDILINAAGIGPRGKATAFKPFVELTEEEWDKQIQNNLKTTYNCVKAVLPTMMKQRSGRIVNISSVTGTQVSNPGFSAYSAAKGGVSGLTKALALEFAQYGITVNAVAPGWIDTGYEGAQKLGWTTPLKRPGKPEEVANLVVFLASEESSYMTGHDIVIDGGNILQEYKGIGNP